MVWPKGNCARCSGQIAERCVQVRKVTAMMLPLWDAYTAASGREYTRLNS